MQSRCDADIWFIRVYLRMDEVWPVEHDIRVGENGCIQPRIRPRRPDSGYFSFSAVRHFK